MAVLQTLNAKYNAHVSAVSRTDPARASALWQGGDGYYGVDKLENVRLDHDTSFFASTPGFDGAKANYAVPHAPTTDSATFHESVQVGATYGYQNPYREFVSSTQLDAGSTVAVGTAHANPQFGGGGGQQIFHQAMVTHAPTPFAPAAGTAHATSQMSPDVRTMGESTALRNLMHAPWRATAYVAPAVSND